MKDIDRSMLIEEITKESLSVAEINYTKEAYLEYAKLDSELYYGRYDHLTKKQRDAKIESVRSESKINRNSKCPCNSGKKYKKCCINNQLKN